MTFAVRLRQLLEDHRLTQRALAARAQLDAAEISRFATGAKLPGAAQMRRLAAAFDLTVEAFLDGVDDVDELRATALGLVREEVLAAEVARLRVELEATRAELADERLLRVIEQQSLAERDAAFAAQGQELATNQQTIAARDAESREPAHPSRRPLGDQQGSRWPAKRRPGAVRP